MQETEELLYTPQLHWMFTIKPLIQSLPFFLLLLICWLVLRNYSGLLLQSGCCISVLFLHSILKCLFLTGLIIVLLVFVWRIFRYVNTEYGITNKRLIIKKGVLRITVAEIPFDRIESIYCVQGILARVFKYGNIFVSGIGGMMPVFFMVYRPFALRRKIVDIIEKNKTITVIHGDLPKNKPLIEPEPPAKEEPFFRYGTFVRVLPENR